MILIGTGGKGTGAGTIFPLAEMARRLRKLVLPIFVRPSFERHEVDKRRYDHALKVGEQFDAAGIRLIEILNDRGYDEVAPKPQLVVWERMNLPIARGLRGLIYVLWDLCQVDPSDLSMLFAGHGRLRIGFGEIDCSYETDPRDEQIDQAVRSCWENPYYAFGRPAGTSLVCIHGEWSNIVDAKIKSRLAEAAVAGAGPYNPLYTRAVQSPRPWGVTALFGEYTGVHSPLDVDWAFGRRDVPAVARKPVAVVVDGPANAGHYVREATVLRDVSEPTIAPATAAAVSAPATVDVPPAVVDQQPEIRMPSGLWEFAVAVNRADPAALALAGNGETAELPIDGLEVKKLLGTMWFRAILPRFSQQWRARILDALVNGVALPNHVMRVKRRAVPMSDLDYDAAPGACGEIVGTRRGPCRSRAAGCGRAVVGQRSDQAISFRSGAGAERIVDIRRVAWGPQTMRCRSDTSDRGENRGLLRGSADKPERGARNHSQGISPARTALSS